MKQRICDHIPVCIIGAAVLVFISGLGYSNSAVPPLLNRGFEIKVTDINQVEMSISNFGKYGQNQNGVYGCWWPKGSNQHYIWGAGTWFGTIVETDTLVTIGYGPHGGESEYVPGLADMSSSDPDAVIFLYPALWPPPADKFPMAPQSSRSHQDSWCVYNDLDESAHIPGDTRPIGLEVYQTSYAWNLSATSDIIFFKFEVKNVSGSKLTDCYFGVCADNAIGNEIGTNANDIISGIVGQWYVVDGESLWVDNVGYQWQEEEEAGWSGFPGVLAYDYLQSPYDIVTGQDKDGDGIPDEFEQDSSYYVNNLIDSLWDADLDGTPDWRDPSEIPQLGLTAFKRFTLNLEPNLDGERYVTMAGYNFKTGVYEPYDTVPPQPDDQRILQCSGPFELDADSTTVVLIGIMFAHWHEIYGRPDSAVAVIDNTVQFIYDKNWLLPGPPPPPNLTCIPGDKEVTLVWDSYSEVAADPYYDIVSMPGPLFDPYYLQYDFEGYGVWKSLTGETGDWELLSRCDKANGIVFIDTMMNLEATDNGIFHSYVDEDVRNGFTYFYAVSAFDYNYVQDLGLPLGYRPLYFESGYVGIEAVPRRDPADYIPAGDVVVTVASGNEDLGGFVTGRVVSPFEVGAPIYLEYGGPDTTSWFGVVEVVDTFGPVYDTFDYYYPVDGVLHVGYIKDSDRVVVDSAWLQTVTGSGYTAHEFMVLAGYALHGQFGMPVFPTFVELFDTIEVSGVYPAGYVVPLQSRVPLAAILNFVPVYDPGLADTVVVAYPDTAYDRGFWAHRGNDYKVRWVSTHGATSGRANSVEVTDVVTGEVLTYKPFQNTYGTRHLGEGWCFTRHTTWVPWTEPSSDTLRIEGTNATKTRALYINGGLVALRNGGPLLDTLPYVGDTFMVRTAHLYEPASVYGELAVQADAASWATEGVELNVKVVPNPYLVHNEWQQSFSQRRLRFINLPSVCTIRIFNINGELVKTMRHTETVVDDDGSSVVNNAGGDEWWNLLSDMGQLIASGIYIFHVRSEVGEQVGKFVIIR